MTCDFILGSVTISVTDCCLELLGDTKAQSPKPKAVRCAKYVRFPTNYFPHHVLISLTDSWSDAISTDQYTVAENNKRLR